jgi:hypothetical protein
MKITITGYDGDDNVVAEWYENDSETQTTAHLAGMLTVFFSLNEKAIYATLELSGLDAVTYYRKDWV